VILVSSSVINVVTAVWLQADSEHEADVVKPQICLIHPEPKFRMGYKDESWQPVSFEIEMFPREHAKLQELGPHDALNTGIDMFREQVLKSVDEEVDSACTPALFKVKKESDEDSWMWEMEKHEANKPYMFEASSPQAMEENETEIAIVQSSMLEQNFSKYPKVKDDKNPWDDDPPGLHVHVLAKCLIEGDKGDVRRLVAALLIWERFDKQIYEMVGTTLHVGEASLKAAPISEKSPRVLSHLRKYVTQNGWSEPNENRTLGKFFSENENKDKMHGDKTNADGYRRFEVNVCHLLHIKCAHDLPDKEAPAVPKFGALEFRGFDPMVGQPLRLIVMLVQRLVQFACSAPLAPEGEDDNGTLHELAYWNGTDDASAESVDPLFEALEIPKQSSLASGYEISQEVFKSAKFAHHGSGDGKDGKHSKAKN
jgi:hypothetical protein